MAEYHYKYDPPRGGAGGNPNGDNGDGLFGLLLSALFAVVGAIPALIASLVGWVMNLSSQLDKATSVRPNQTAVPTGGAGSNLNKVQRPSASSPAPAKKQPNKEDKRGVRSTAGRGLMIFGGILTGVFGLSLLTLALVNAPTVAQAIVGVFTGAGLLTLWGGLRKRKKARLYLKYLGLIGQRESVGLTALSKAAGRSRKKVCRELQEMLDKGVLPAGYLDLAADRLVLSAKGIEDVVVPQRAPEDENDILRQIKEVNDSIPDPVMTAKIDRIGAITGKILDYQRKNPGRAGQLRSFLNYYLPTTLKILRAYAQLDKQGVEGENISAAKARIEGMMDKVVEGFEKQLDRLFQDEALDITTDVAVLEQMLDKDGLGSGGITLEV